MASEKFRSPLAELVDVNGFRDNIIVGRGKVVTYTTRHKGKSTAEIWARAQESGTVGWYLMHSSTRYDSPMQWSSVASVASATSYGEG